MGKVQQHALERVALVVQQENDLLLVRGRRGDAVGVERLEQFAVRHPRQIDDVLLPFARDEAEFIVLRRVLQPQGHALQCVAQSGVPLVADAEPAVLAQSGKHRAEVCDVRRVGVRVAVRVAVVVHECLGRIERLDLLQTLGGRRKQRDARVEQQRLQPPLFEHGERHGGRVRERCSEVGREQRPALPGQRGRDGQRALGKGALLHERGHAARGQSARHRLGQNGRHRFKVAAVDLMEQHRSHLRKASPSRRGRRKNGPSRADWCTAAARCAR